MARYTGPRTKIARKFGEAIFALIKFLQKRTIPRDNMASIKEEKLLSMVFSFVRNKKLNTRMVYWKDNLEICLRKLRVLRV